MGSVIFSWISNGIRTGILGGMKDYHGIRIINVIGALEVRSLISDHGWDQGRDLTLGGIY